jgi:hypothetical protein
MQDVLTIRLDEETAKALEAEAKRAGSSKGELVRAAIRERFVSRPISVFDGLAALHGIVGGPPDLSTNKRHLESLGRRPTRKRGTRARGR